MTSSPQIKETEVLKNIINEQQGKSIKVLPLKKKYNKNKKKYTVLLEELGFPFKFFLRNDQKAGTVNFNIHFKKEKLFFQSEGILLSEIARKVSDNYQLKSAFNWLEFIIQNQVLYLTFLEGKVKISFMLVSIESMSNKEIFIVYLFLKDYSISEHESTYQVSNQIKSNDNEVAVVKTRRDISHNVDSSYSIMLNMNENKYQNQIIDNNMNFNINSKENNIKTNENDTKIEILDLNLINNKTKVNPVLIISSNSIYNSYNLKTIDPVSELSFYECNQNSFNNQTNSPFSYTKQLLNKLIPFPLPSTVRVIKIENHHMKESDYLVLKEILSQSPISLLEFSLKNTNLNNKSIKSVSSIIKSSQNIVELTLSSNNLNHRSLEILKEAFNSKQILRKIDFSHNEITANSLQLLYYFILKIKNIVEMNLVGNYITKDEIQMLNYDCKNDKYSKCFKL